MPILLYLLLAAGSGGLKNYLREREREREREMSDLRTRMRDKVCIVTGSTKGIGLAIAERFLKEVRDFVVVVVVVSTFTENVYYTGRESSNHVEESWECGKGSSRIESKGID